MRIIKKYQQSKFAAYLGIPKDKSYLECGLPQWLEESIEQMKIELYCGYLHALTRQNF